MELLAKKYQTSISSKESNKDHMILMAPFGLIIQFLSSMLRAILLAIIYTKRYKNNMLIKLHEVVMGFLAIKKDKSVRAGHISCQYGCVAVSYAPTRSSANAFSKEDFLHTESGVSLNGITATGLSSRSSELLLLIANNTKASDQSKVTILQ